MATNQEARERILLALLAGHVAVRSPSHTWRWAERREGAPSLANPHTAALFQMDYVTECDGQLALTAMGLIIARRIQ